MIKKYDKLVRNKIPEIIKNDGKEVIIKSVSDEEKLNYLKDKLVEEVDEYLESEEVEELADLVEVIYSILDNKDISLEEFEKLRIEKKKERGGFSQGIVLKEVRNI